MSELPNLVSLYATVVTIVLFFQGIEITRWSADLHRLNERKERHGDDLLTDKRLGEEYLTAVATFKHRFPGFLGWTYVTVQALLVLISVFGLVPAAFPSNLVLAELPFIVLGLVCVVLWPSLIAVEKQRLGGFEREVKRRHGLP